MLGTLYLGDYVSLYLAVLRRVDPMVLKPIVALKAKLAAARRKSGTPGGRFELPRPCSHGVAGSGSSGRLQRRALPV